MQKRQSSQQCHLALLGPTSLKAGRQMLVKLTPGGRGSAALGEEMKETSEFCFIQENGQDLASSASIPSSSFPLHM